MATAGVWTAIKVIGFLFTLFYRPKFKQSGEQQKPGDLQLQTSSRGAPISLVYGRRRLPGNVIWYDNFLPVPNYTDVKKGLLGGSDQVFSHYTYSVSFAIGICMGPAEILRIWQGKDEIPGTDWTALGITIYNGTLDQEVDSHIETFLSRATAYRGLCYVVFQNFNLGQSTFIPNFTFEVDSTDLIKDYDRKWGRDGGLSGSGDGQFNNPTGINVYGDEVYVTDNSNLRVQVFNLAGTFQRKWATGANCDKLDVYNDEVYVGTGQIGHNNFSIKVYDTAGVFQREFGSEGTGNGEFKGIGGIRGYNDEIYVVDKNNNRVQVFTTSGTYVRKFSAIGGPRALTVYNDEVYIGRDIQNVQVTDLNGVPQRSIASSVIGTGVSHYNDEIYIVDSSANPVKVSVYSPSGTLVDSWGTTGFADGEFTAPQGIFASGGEVFIADTGRNRIQVFSSPPDLTPPFIVKDLLTNAFYGLGLSLSDLDTTTFDNTDTFCTDNDLLISILIDSTISVSDLLLNIAAHHNGFFTDNSGTIAYNQIETEGIATTVNVETDVVKADPPVEIIRDSFRDVRNRVRIRYTKRSDNYAAGYISTDDEVHQTSHGIIEGEASLNGFMTGARAQKIGYTILRRTLEYPMRYKFKVGPKKINDLSLGTVFGLTDSRLGWTNEPVRVMAIKEAKESKWDITAVEEITYILDSKTAPSDSPFNPPATGGDPGSVQNPMVSEIFPLIALDENLVLINYSESGDTQWAGVTVWGSWDDTNYEVIARQNGAGLTGVIDSITDDSITITIVDSSVSLTSHASVEEMIEALNSNLCWLKENNTFFRFTTATLVAGSQWTLSGFVWDLYNFPIMTHAASVGDKVSFLTYNNDPISVSYLTDNQGDTLYVKVVSFNFQGTSEDISDVTAQTLNFEARGSKPIKPQNVGLSGKKGITTLGPEALVFAWRTCNRLNRGLVYDRTDQIVEDSDFVRFNITVKQGSNVLRNTSTTDVTWTYTLAMWIADGSYRDLTFEFTKITTLRESDTVTVNISFVFIRLMARLTVLREDSSDLKCRLDVVGLGIKNLVNRVNVRALGTESLVCRVNVILFVAWEFAYESVITDGGQAAGTSIANTYVDDASYDQIEEVTGVPGFDFYYKHADVIDCDKVLKVIGYYQGNPPHEVWLYIRDFDGSGWDRVTAAATDFPSTGADAIHEFELPHDSKYVSADNEMWFRYYHPDSGNATHNMYINLHELRCATVLMSSVTVTEGLISSKVICRVTVTS